jgi:hypothetical protein
MVKKTLGFWLIICVGQFIFATVNAGQLNIHLQQRHVEWGQSIHGKLVAHNAKTEMSEIDLTPLHEDFAVVTEAASSEAAANIQTMNLELFPRRTGMLTVPMLRLGELQSAQQTVEISNAIIQDTPLVVNVKVSGQEVWQRQQVLVTVEIKSPERFFNLEAEPLDAGSFEIRPFVMSREAINSDRITTDRKTDPKNADDASPNRVDNDLPYRSRILAGWAIFPLLSGTFTLELPMIHYLTGGKIQRRFFLPHITIQVRELPAYIPPNMPVAKVSVASEFMTNGLLQTGHMAYWNITLAADGTLAYWLPPILHHMQSSNQVEYLPAKSWPSMKIDATGAHAQVVHQVPFKPQRIGSLHVPQLKIQYFDPDSGRIETVHHQTPTLFTWNIALIAVVCLLLGLLLLKGGNRVSQQYKRIKQKRFAIGNLKDANNPRQILTALQQLAIVEGWPTNVTVSDFLRLWQQRYHGDDELTALLIRLSRSAYGGQGDDALREMQCGLLRKLSQARRQRQAIVTTENPAWDVKNLFIRD